MTNNVSIFDRYFDTNHKCVDGIDLFALSVVQTSRLADAVETIGFKSRPGPRPRPGMPVLATEW